MGFAKLHCLCLILLLSIIAANQSWAASPEGQSKALVLATEASWDDATIERACWLSIQEPSFLMLHALGGIVSHKFQLKNLLGSLRECHDCPLDRIVNPCKRASFENKVIEDIRQQHTTPSELLVLTSFASGGLFQEFVLLNKIHHRGYRQVRLNLIDPIYAKYMQSNFRYDHAEEFQKSSMWQFSNYFDSLTTLDSRFHYDIRYYKSSADYIADVKAHHNSPSHVIFNIDSSVSRFDVKPTTELELAMADLLVSGLFKEGGIIYTLAESSDKVQHTLKTTAQGTTTSL